MKTKKYDCVADVRKIRDAMYLETKDMTHEEELNYYRENSSLNKTIKGKRNTRKSA